ncbi:hypothetical protein BDW02DRAFT_525584 [Decorospora gaudefroyi]|uniref:Uncharacterized protein n=1 Tax=Decorospora gaudefroyi TaxID=184978 RepID=A0A6A5KEA5_9PLEO|nr:hypothetical protein BDW02DRAFT_525584 [Decorospora gaudefroyi]
MLALGHLIKKPKTDDKEVQQFGTTIAADQKQLVGLLAQRTMQAEKEETRRRDELASSILKALQTSNRPVESESSNFAGTRIASNAVHTSVMSILSASEGLIKEYQRLDDMIAELRDEQAEPIADTWKQNVEDTDRQLRMGARVALMNVKKVLGADVERGAMETADAEGDMDMDGGQGDEIELNYELQKSLRYAERGVKRMVKRLPVHEAY